MIKGERLEPNLFGEMQERPDIAMIRFRFVTELEPLGVFEGIAEAEEVDCEGTAQVTVVEWIKPPDWNLSEWEDFDRRTWVVNWAEDEIEILVLPGVWPS